jgi:AcrR family transcriptional regulator
MLAGASTDSGPGGKHRLSGEERRASIVRAAVELFAKHGFRGTTTRELAAAVGVSEPVLYQHFATKKDLYTAIVEQMMAESSRTFEQRASKLPEDADERQFFEWLGETILAWHADMASSVRLLLFGALEGHELAEIWHERATRQHLEFVDNYVKKRVEEGKFRAINYEIAARAFIWMMGHFGLVANVFCRSCTRQPREEVVRQCVDIFLRGVERPGAKEDEISQ